MYAAFLKFGMPYFRALTRRFLLLFRQQYFRTSTVPEVEGLRFRAQRVYTRRYKLQSEPSEPHDRPPRVAIRKLGQLCPFLRDRHISPIHRAQVVSLASLCGVVRNDDDLKVLRGAQHPLALQSSSGPQLEVSLAAHPP